MTFLPQHPKVVQELLGHSQISVTMDTYTHVLPTCAHGLMTIRVDLIATSNVNPCFSCSSALDPVSEIKRPDESRIYLKQGLPMHHAELDSFRYVGQDPHTAHMPAWSAENGDWRMPAVVGVGDSDTVSTVGIDGQIRLH